MLTTFNLDYGKKVPVILKHRSPSSRLLIYRSLNKRMELTADEKRYYYILEKGYEGEVKFDQLVEDKLHTPKLILNDLELEHQNESFQIDNLMISGGAVHLNDVKNFENDYVLKHGRFFYAPTNKEIKNPLDQLNRSERLLNNLFYSLNFDVSIVTHLVFVNPEFTLYLPSPNEKIILPTQANRFLNKLNSIPSNLINKDKKLAEKLLAEHKTKSTFTKFPAYSFSKLKKGLFCSACQSFAVSLKYVKIVCEDCGCEETVESAVLRNVEEIKLLFHEMKITTNLVHEWCGGVLSKQRIKRILGKHYKITGISRWAFYE